MIDIEMFEQRKLATINFLDSKLYDFVSVTTEKIMEAINNKKKIPCPFCNKEAI